MAKRNRPAALKFARWSGNVSASGNRSHTVNKNSIASKPLSPIPPDDLQRDLVVARPGEDQNLPHIGLVGDTYTILLSGDDTDGRMSPISAAADSASDGRPPPHRHDFEESFTLLEGKIEAVFRGQKIVLVAGQTISIPANARTRSPTRLSLPGSVAVHHSPAGQEAFSRRLVFGWQRAFDKAS